MKISTTPGDFVVTHALGSCLGISLYDPIAGVGGIAHFQLPMSKLDPVKARANPFMFIDTGVPAFFRALYDAGGEKARIVVKVAGGANVQNTVCDRFEIGKRNFIVLRKLLWKNRVLIKGEDVGGTCARTMRLEIGSGQVILSSAGESWEL